MRVAIIDYGSGNLKSATKAFERAAHQEGLRAEIELTSNAERVATADRIVLPGVGAFASCRAGLDAVPNMVQVLQERVFDNGVPFLGICVGAQLLGDQGLEKTTTDGLGWIGADVVEITPDDPSIKVPQIGWNTLTVQNDHPLLKDIELGPDGLHAYFVHSYHLQVKDPNHVVATTDYGQAVTAMIARDNMVGTQFHPEKSQTMGLALIANFLRWKP